MKNLKQRFIDAAKKGHKVLVPVPEGPERIDLILTDTWLISYSHRKGNHWNLFGSHWYYIHDLDGNFIESVNGFKGKLNILQKERCLKKDALDIMIATVTN